MNTNFEPSDRDRVVFNMFYRFSGVLPLGAIPDLNDMKRTDAEVDKSIYNLLTELKQNGCNLNVIL